MTPHIAIGIDKQLDYLVGLFLQDHMLIMLDQVYQLLSVIVSMKEGKYYIIITNCAWSCLLPMQSLVVWSCLIPMQSFVVYSCLILLGNSSVGLSKLSAKAICHQLKMYKRWGPAFYINIHHHSVEAFSGLILVFYTTVETLYVIWMILGNKTIEIVLFKGYNFYKYDWRAAIIVINL